MRFYNSLWKVAKFLKISQNFSKFLKISQNFSKFLKISQNFSKFLKISQNFSKFLKISQNFSKFLKISQNFSKFLKISQNFTIYYGILLRFDSTLIYFITFRFLFQSFRKFTTKFWSHSKWLKFLNFWTWGCESWKVNITYIYII